MINWENIANRGWTAVDGVSSNDDLMDLARMLGPIRLHPNGDAIREIRVTPSHNARPETLSAKYGTQSFPLHTDTAFWTTPVRYLALRVTGDRRRPTTVLPLRAVFREDDPGAYELADRAIWRLRTPSVSAYCLMRFQVGSDPGWRFDSQCMRPANTAAMRVMSVLEGVGTQQNIHFIDWSTNSAVVISNWTALHGRGPEPVEEQERVLFRVYVG